jgi:hypothetical protein
MNINVVTILYVIGIIICDLIYHLKELYVIYASEIIVRSIVYIVCKTVITVEFPNAKNRRKQIKVHLNLPVEKMGHLYRVIKQRVITKNHNLELYLLFLNFLTSIWSLASC